MTAQHFQAADKTIFTRVTAYGNGNKTVRCSSDPFPAWPQRSHIPDHVPKLYELMPKLIDRFLRQIDQASSFLFCIYLMDLRVPARTRQNALLGVAWTDPFEICQDHKCLVASLRRETNCSTRAQDSPGPPAICGETSSRPDAPSQLEYSQDSANRLRGSGKNTNCCLVRTSKNSKEVGFPERALSTRRW